MKSFIGPAVLIYVLSVAALHEAAELSAREALRGPQSQGSSRSAPSQEARSAPAVEEVTWFAESKSWLGVGRANSGPRGITTLGSFPAQLSCLRVCHQAGEPPDLCG